MTFTSTQGSPSRPEPMYSPNSPGPQARPSKRVYLSVAEHPARPGQARSASRKGPSARPLERYWERLLLGPLMSLLSSEAPT